MKKSLIALAIASAVSAPAFAATSNVDVYGKLIMSVSVFNDQEESASDTQISSTGSRVGVKGTEDLGGGLAAIWQLESGVSLDEQTGSLTGRNSFVGLKSDAAGTVLIGNHDTPLKLVGRAVDLFPDTMADSRNVMGGGSDTRAKNVVAYISPNWTGFSLAAAYSTDLEVADMAGFTPTYPVPGTNGDRTDRGVYNVNATYANGPLFLGLGYGDGDGHEALGLGTHWRAAAGFTFANFKVVGQYDSLEDDTAAGEDYDAWMVGGSYTMGAMVFKANYMEGEWDNVVGDESERQQWTVGMDYNLSKRTGLYALYSNGENVTFGGGAGSSDRIDPNDADLESDVISVGVIHSF